MEPYMASLAMLCRASFSLWVAVSLFLISSLASAGEMKSVGIIVNDIQNPFYAALAHAASQRAALYTYPPAKKPTIFVMSSNYDANTQIRQIEELIDKKVDLIVLTSADPERIGDVIGRALAAGIHVVAADSATKGAEVTVMTDNVSAGFIGCEYLASVLGSNAKILILSGPKVTPVLDRVAGCKQALASKKGITIVGGEPNGQASSEGANERTQELLGQGIKFDGVFAISDLTGIGVENAVAKAGKNTVKIVSVDGSPLVYTRLKKANSQIVASAAQFPGHIGEIAIEQGIKLVENKKVWMNKVLVPSRLIDRDNLDSYGGWGATGK